MKTHLEINVQSLTVSTPIIKWKTVRQKAPLLEYHAIFAVSTYDQKQITKKLRSLNIVTYFYTPLTIYLEDYHVTSIIYTDRLFWS